MGTVKLITVFFLNLFSTINGWVLLLFIKNNLIKNKQKSYWSWRDL